MAGHDSDRNGALTHQRGKAKADGFEARQVDLFGIEPAGIVFAKAGRFDEGQAFEFGSVGSEILARLGKHATSDRSPASHKQGARHLSSGVRLGSNRTVQNASEFHSYQ